MDWVPLAKGAVEADEEASHPLPASRSAEALQESACSLYYFAYPYQIASNRWCYSPLHSQQACGPGRLDHLRPELWYLLAWQEMRGAIFQIIE